MFNYSTYQTLPDALTFEQALALYNEIHIPETETDADFQELWQDVVRSAVTYVGDRNQWQLMTTAEKAAFDHRRTLDHNSYMATVVALGRYCNRQWQTDWLTKLGTPEQNRKRFGDFAGYLVLFGNLSAR